MTCPPSLKRRLFLPLMLAGLLAHAEAATPSFSYRIPIQQMGAKGGTDPSAPAEGSTGAAKGYWVLTGSISGYSKLSLMSNGYVTSCPAGGIDPTSSSAAPSAATGEPFNADSVVDLQWELPPSWPYPYAAATTRVWCIPADEADVRYIGDMTPTSIVSGNVTAINQTVTPNAPGADPLGDPAANIISTVISAKGQNWSFLVTSFWSGTYNGVTGDWPYMDGRKLAVGRNSGGTATYFGAAPLASYNGYSYQNSSGTITFNAAPRPACMPLAQPAPGGTGGAIADLSRGAGFSMMLKQDGSVWMTGYNTDGQYGICKKNLGDYPITWYRVATGMAAVGAGTADSVAFVIKQDGTVMKAGTRAQSSGADGNGISSPRPDYQFYPIATNGKQVDGDASSTVLLKKDGTLWYTGGDSWGEAGQGAVGSAKYYNFVQVDSNVAFFKNTFGNLLYVKNDGSLWATGSSSYSKLGNNFYGGGFDSTPGSRPLKLADNVISMDGDLYYIAYVTADGKVYGAGNDSYSGQFGQGTRTNLPYFTQIAGYVGPVKQVVSVGRQQLRLLTTSGDIWVAGGNGGSYGDGSTTDSNVFVKVLAGQNIKFLAGAQAVGPDGRLWVTGNNSTGIYGDGTQVSSAYYKTVAY